MQEKLENVFYCTEFLTIIWYYYSEELISMVKFGLSEKHTFEKKIPHGFDKSADILSKRQNHDFFKLCVLLKKSELY